MKTNLISLTFLLVILSAGFTYANRRHGQKQFRGGHNWRTQQNYEDVDEVDDGQQVQVIEGENEAFTDDDDFTPFLPGRHYATNPPKEVIISPTPTTEAFKQTEPEVETGVGKIIGKTVRTTNGKVVYEFLGIPFAKPPIGDLKFKRPLPTEHFTEPFHATELPNTCTQESSDVFNGFVNEKMWNPNTNVSEDCLYLNIWVPEEALAQNKKDKTVLFWIYGGGFFSGTSTLDQYKGAQLSASEGVIVVSTQYRVGPQGFLYFGTDDAPGNVGLWDQNLALKWVHQNIEFFGGNVDDVTLIGESAGAASVSYHLLSPKSRDYFKRAVMMSAVPDAVYSFIHPNALKHRSYKFASLAGCDVKQDPSEIVACLREKDSMDLAKLQWKILKKNTMLDFPLKPTIDGKFIRDYPNRIVRNGDAKRADIMIGTVDNEGSYFILYYYLNIMHHQKPSKITRDKFTEIMREIFAEFPEIELQAIINHYKNWENPDDSLQNQKRISDAVGDYFFTCPSRKFADMWSNRGLKVYYYHFTHKSSTNKWADWMGVMHGDEIEYMLGQPLNTSHTYTPGEKQLSMYMTRMLANFARAGSPSENWDRYTTEVPLYLDLNATNPSDKTTPNQYGPREDHCVLWNKFLPKLRRLSSTCKQTRNSKKPFFRRQHKEQRGVLRGVHGGRGFHVREMDGADPVDPRCSPPVPTALPKSLGGRPVEDRREESELCRCYEETPMAPMDDDEDDGDDEFYLYPISV